MWITYVELKRSALRPPQGDFEIALDNINAAIFTQ